MLEEVKYDKANSFQLNPFVIYEANEAATLILKSSTEIKPLCICDDNPSKIGKLFYGYTVMSLKDALLKYQDFDIYIASEGTDYSKAKERILKQVDENRIIKHCTEFININDSKQEEFIDFFKANEERINYLYEILSDEESKMVLTKLVKGFLSKKSKYFSEITSIDQYFPDVVKLSKNEVFIDGGAYHGESIGMFKFQTNDEYKSIHSFEPTKKSFRMLEKIKKIYFNNDSKIFLYKYGLSDKNGKVYFQTFNADSSANKVVSTETDNSIDVVCLDDVINDEVTYIKLDVEGSEIAALKGAKKIIDKNKPKLAVCVYHNIEDIINIPQFIIGLGLPYKYYLRHHGTEPNLWNETVFYAV